MDYVLRNFTMILISHHSLINKVTPTPTSITNFIPLAQGTAISCTSLNTSFLRNVTWFDTIKTNRDPVQALKTFISTNIIFCIMSQPRPFFLTELSFDSTFTAVNTSLFDTKIKSVTYDADFQSLLQEITQVTYQEIATDTFNLFQAISQDTTYPQYSTKTERISVATYNNFHFWFVYRQKISRVSLITIITEESAWIT